MQQVVQFYNGPSGHVAGVGQPCGTFGWYSLWVCVHAYAHDEYYVQEVLVKEETHFCLVAKFHFQCALGPYNYIEGYHSAGDEIS